MLPVACLPICGILMGLGYWMCPATMQGGEINGIIQQIGFYLVKAGGALIDNMAILFAIGIGVGMADDNDGTAALSALASWLMITNLLSTANVSVIRTLSETSTLAFDKIANPFIGIIAGLIGSMCYNRFKNTSSNSIQAYDCFSKCNQCSEDNRPNKQQYNRCNDRYNT